MLARAVRGRLSVDWQRVAPGFEWDGSWRDIYVLGTSRSDWQAVWQVLQALEPAPIFTAGGVSGQMPGCVDAAFDDRAMSTSMLSFEVGRIGFNCHFFTPDEIEFDFDPRRVTGPSEAEALAGFMKLLGEVTGKPVSLADEGAKEGEIARFCPSTGEVSWAAHHRP